VPTVATASCPLLLGYKVVMTTDPRRIVEDLQAKVVDEEGVMETADDSPPASAEDASSTTPGVEPTD
jgi:hypothetical protein